MRFWSAYVFIAGPIAWLGLILAQASRNFWPLAPAASSAHHRCILPSR